MQFSDTSTNQGLIEDITFWTGMDTTAYALVDRTRNINRWYYDIVTKILRTNADWEFDDTEKTDMPTLTTDLVASQEDYELPKSSGNAYGKQGGATGGGILKLFRVEIKDANGIWVQLDQLDQKNVGQALGEFMKTAGVPRYYDVRNNSLFLKPAPASGSVTTSGGLKIYIAREAYTFISTDTTREPGFAENFHRILSLGASFDWFDAKQQHDRADRLMVRIEKMMSELLLFYGGRNLDKTQRIIPRNIRGRQAR